MIDTDNYEGHTLDYIWAWKRYASYIDHDADRALVQDAPLLLREVKRLRQAFLIATGHIGWGNHLGHAELRHALNSVGIDADSLSWADGEWSEEE